MGCSEKAIKQNESKKDGMVRKGEKIRSGECGEGQSTIFTVIVENRQIYVFSVFLPNAKLSEPRSGDQTLAVLWIERKNGREKVTRHG